MKIDKLSNEYSLELPEPCQDCECNEDIIIDVIKKNNSIFGVYEYSIMVECPHQNVCKYLARAVE